MMYNPIYFTQEIYNVCIEIQEYNGYQHAF